MLKTKTFGTAAAYAAPECEILEVNIEAGILETSFTGSSIEDGTLEDWETL